MRYLKYVMYVKPALVFIMSILEAADDGKITANEVWMAAKKTCKSLGINVD